MRHLIGLTPYKWSLIFYKLLSQYWKKMETRILLASKPFSKEKISNPIDIVLRKVGCVAVFSGVVRWGRGTITPWDFFLKKINTIYIIYFKKISTN